MYSTQMIINPHNPIYANLISFFRTRHALDINSAITITDIDLIEIGFPVTKMSKVTKLYPFILAFDKKYYLDQDKLKIWHTKQQQVTTVLFKVWLIITVVSISILLILYFKGIL